MARVVDNLIAYKLLTMLVTPFEETDAYKLGIIDNDGKNLIKASKLDTSEQKDAYTYLHRLVFNIKKILNRLPGGDTKLKNIVAAFWLVKESYEGRQDSALFENVLIKIIESKAILVEETIMVEKCMKKMEEDGEGGPIANVTGAGVSTDLPAPSKKTVDKYKMKNINGALAFARRPKPVE